MVGIEQRLERIPMALSQAQINELITNDQSHDCGPDAHTCVSLAGVAELPSRFGEFQIAGFHQNIDDKEHAAFIRGDICHAEDVPVRMHSECLTGDAAGSLRCDCRDQLEAAMVSIGKMDCGILLYLRQEGRGIGLTNKVRAYQLQDQGMDTVEANLALGFPDDTRDYSIAAHMLQSLNVKSVQLMTNNPKKIAGLEAYGVNVSARIPHVMEPTEHNVDYLATKAAKSGHLISLDEQGEPLRTP